MTSTDLASRLREVHGLHAFAELFGFDWHDGSDWDWHDVACAMADAIDATAGGYGITFAPTLDRPPETMVGETVYDSEGNAIGWVANATAGVGTCKNERTATIVKVPRQSHVALGHYECGGCGQTIDAGDRYCRKCGACLEGANQ